MVSLRSLLYASGHRLESAVRRAFEALGFIVTTYRDDEREIDLILEFEGHRFVGEVEGKETKAVDVNKLSQLERIMAEDYERPEVSEYARGILVGNAYRLTAPSERGPPFTDKVLSAAERRGILLVDTNELFSVCRAAINGDEKLRQRARETLVKAQGGQVRLMEE